MAKSVSIGEAAVGLVDVWWAEARPEEGGRVQIVRHRPGGERVDVLPEGFDARTRVHEYGGGAWCLHQADLVFANWADQRLCRLDAGADHPLPLTPEPAHDHGDRYADGRFTADAHWVICVRERHPEGDGEPTNEIVAVWSRPRGEIDEPVVLVTGPDFVASPRLSPDGRHLAWFQWHHPDMPWDGTELHVAEIHTDPTASAASPSARRSWSPAAATKPSPSRSGPTTATCSSSPTAPTGGTSTGSRRAGGSSGGRRPGCAGPRAHDGGRPIDAEIGVPQWVFDPSRYAVLADGRILVAFASLTTAGGSRPERDPSSRSDRRSPPGRRCDRSNGAVLVVRRRRTRPGWSRRRSRRRAPRHHRGRDRDAAPATRPRRRSRVRLVPEPCRSPPRTSASPTRSSTRRPTPSTGPTGEPPR